MASLSKTRTGSKRLQVTVDGKRRSIGVGRMTASQAERLRENVAILATLVEDGSQPPADLQRWLSKLSDKLHSRLARNGLCEPRRAKGPGTVGGLFTAYQESRAATQTASTQRTLGHGLRPIAEHLGTDRPVRSVTTTDVEALRDAMLRDGLSPATIARRMGYGSAAWRYAIKVGSASTNPFADADVSRSVRPTERRDYVETETVERVVGALQDAGEVELAAVVALARVAGLRIPSEVRSMVWDDIDFEARTLLVRSPKTAHHGQATRTCPLFPRCEEALRAVHTQSLDTSEGALVLPRLRRWSDPGLRRPVEAAIRRAGVKPWRRLFTSLRSSAATDLADKFPSHVAAAWLGHNVATADKHYRQTTDEHHRRAVGLPSENRVDRLVAELQALDPVERAKIAELLAAG